MVELYIEGNKIELNGEPKISFNYTALNVEEPAAIKNSFSSTIKIPGTKVNNTIFGHIWKTDRYSIAKDADADENKLMFTNFDANRRVNFQLVNNGDVVESGYVQLLDVEVNKSEITYSVVLYGGIGNFFYTLMYGETEREKSLKDLYFGWKPTLQEENNTNLGLWDRNFINYSWNYMKVIGGRRTNITNLFTFFSTNVVDAQTGNLIYDTTKFQGLLHGTNFINITSYAGRILEITVPYISCQNEDMKDFGLVIKSNQGEIVYSHKMINKTFDGEDIFTRGSYKMRIKLEYNYNQIATTFWSGDEYGKFSAEVIDQDDPLKLDITAVPCYNGYYEDFDNDKCLIDHGNQIFDISTYFPSTYTEDNKTYGLFNNKYNIVEMPRELVEWEVRDLRASKQRVGVKFSSIFDAICDARNNGGFNVVLDEEFKETDYFKNTYVMLNSPQWDEYDSKNSVIGNINMNPENSSELSATVDLTNTNGGIFDFTEMSDARVKLNMSFQFGFKNPSSNDENRYGATSYNIANVVGTGGGVVDQYYWKGYGMRIEIYSADTNVYLGSTPTTFFYEPRRYNTPYLVGQTQYYQYSMANMCAATLLRELNSKYYKDKPATTINFQPFYKEATYQDGNVYHYAGDVVYNERLNLSSSIKRVKLKLNIIKGYVKIEFSQAYKTDPSMWLFAAGTGNDKVAPVSNAQMFSSMGGVIRDCTTEQFMIETGVTYDSQASSSVTESHIRKDVIFGDSSSPYKYLVDFTKIFGLKYRYDNHTNTVYIERRDNYYTGETEELVVDISKKVKVNPTNTTNRWYILGLETPDTYAAYLYKKNNTDDYGSKKISTDYQFNNTEKYILESNIYKNLIPYRLNSYYFKETQYPSVVLSPSFKYTLYAGDENKELTMTKQWDFMKNDYSIRYNDSTNRLCVFDRDSNTMEDVSNALVFFNGFQPSKMRLSDDIDVMYELNGKACYLYTQDYHTAFQDVEIPLFTKMINYEDGNTSDSYSSSLDFTLPSQIFGDDSIKYSAQTTIYSRYWEKYLGDIYNKNTKSIVVYCYLKDNPVEAMRKFYFYDNAFWVISDISNYIIGSEEAVKVTLLKVNDRFNYSKNKDFGKDTGDDDKEYTRYYLEINPDIVTVDWNTPSVTININAYKTVGSRTEPVAVSVKSGYADWINRVTGNTIILTNNTTPAQRETQITFYITEHPETEGTVTLRQESSFVTPQYDNRTIHYKTVDNSIIETAVKLGTVQEEIPLSLLGWESQLLTNKYDSQLGHCVITFASDITEIPDHFFDCGYLETDKYRNKVVELIHLPATIKKIGNGFMKSCTSAETIDLTNITRIESVGEDFLNGCSSLKSFDCIGFKGVSTIPGYFLNACSKITQLNLNGLESVRDIGTSFCGTMYALPTVDLTPLKNVETIGSGFFHNADALETIDLTPMTNVTSIGSTMLFSCDELKTIYIEQNRIFPLTGFNAPSKLERIVVPCNLVDNYKTTYSSLQKYFICGDEVRYNITVSPMDVKVDSDAGEFKVKVTATKTTAAGTEKVDFGWTVPSWIRVAINGDDVTVTYTENTSTSSPRVGNVTFFIYEENTNKAILSVEQEQYYPTTYELSVNPDTINANFIAGSYPVTVSALKKKGSNTTTVDVGIKEEYPDWVHPSLTSINVDKNTDDDSRNCYVVYYIKEHPETIFNVRVIQYEYNHFTALNEIHYKTSDNQPLTFGYKQENGIGSEIKLTDMFWGQWNSVVENKYDPVYDHCVITFKDELYFIPDYFFCCSFYETDKYKDKLTEIIYLPPRAASNIGNYFCGSCTALTKVNMGLKGNYTPHYLGTHFLYMCTSLTKIKFTEHNFVNYQKIDDYFMAYCSKLTSIDELNKFKYVTSIGNNFLGGMYALESVDLSAFKDVTTIGGSFLANNESITELDLTPLEKLESTGSLFLWSSRSKINKIKILQGRVFPLDNLYRPNSLQEIQVPCSLVDSYKNKYSQWSSLFKCDGFIVYPNNELHYKTSDNSTIPIYGNFTVQSNVYDDDLGHCVITFDRDVTSISDSQFRGKNNLTEIIWLPSTITTIGKYFLYQNSNLNKVELRSLINVTSIDYYFLGDSSIEEIDISALSNASISNFFLYNCRWLETIIINSDKVFNLDKIVFERSSSLESIYVPNSLVEEYKSKYTSWASYIKPIEQ